MEDGLRIALTEQPDIVILDLDLNDGDGLALCRTLREAPATRKIRVLIYTGDDSPERLTDAFAAGADDYICKTAHPRELLARIVAKIRRIEESQQPTQVEACGNLKLDNKKLEASINGEVLQLSVLEFNLVRFFVLNKECVVSRDQILAQVWKGAVVSNRTIDTHMVYLRKKLKGFDHSFATIYGAGYILKKSDEAAPSPELPPTELQASGHRAN